MKEKLNFSELIMVASMLFGMFFGAGNLIFPVHLGQLAGSNVWLAVAGFIVTGVGLPLLGVVALGISRSDNLMELSGKVSRPYSMFYTCALYLTIGPFFAIPRCATVPYTVGITPILGENAGAASLAVFSLVFFGVVLWFSLRPSGILTWIGKILNPVFLIFLGALLVVALINPLGAVSQIEPDSSYESGAFFSGFLEGYNTMDALASLAFGVIVINVVRGLGVKEPAAVASNTIRAGIFSCILMAVLYIAITVIGAQSRGIFPITANGGEALTDISGHYFGTAGTIVLALIVTFACLKTAIGLITSCAEIFTEMFPRSPGNRFWTFLFCGISFLLANVGLTAIIEYAVPILMLLCPLAITLILLAIFGKYFENDRAIYIWVTVFTFAAAIFDLLKALPEGVRAILHIDPIIEEVGRLLPFFDIGLGWVCPALFGLAIGTIIYITRKKTA